MTYLHYKNYLGKKRKIKIIDGKYFQLNVLIFCNYVSNVTIFHVSNKVNQLVSILLVSSLLKNVINNNELLSPFVIIFFGKVISKNNMVQLTILFFRG